MLPAANFCGCENARHEARKVSQLTLLHKSYTEDGTLVSFSSNLSCKSPTQGLKSNIKFRNEILWKTARIEGGIIVWVRWRAPASNCNNLWIILNTGRGLPTGVQNRLWDEKIHGHGHGFSCCPSTHKLTWTWLGQCSFSPSCILLWPLDPH